MASAIIMSTPRLRGPGLVASAFKSCRIIQFKAIIILLSTLLLPTPGPPKIALGMLLTEGLNEASGAKKASA